MTETWKDHFSLKQLSLTHDRPITFVISQWQREPARPSFVYLVYRWAAALLFFVTIVLSIVDPQDPDVPADLRAKWLIYLTNWGYTMCTLQALMAAVMITVCCFAPDFESESRLRTNALKMYKPYWVANVIATDLSFGITVIYWSLIYDEETMVLDVMNVFVHANNSLMMLIDLLVVSHPVRPIHCLYPVLFGLCYAVFSVIFYAAGGLSREGQRYIYTILKWSNPGVATGVCFGVTAFVVVLHLITWGVYKLRVRMHSGCERNPED